MKVDVQFKNIKVATCELKHQSQSIAVSVTKLIRLYIRRDINKVLL